MDKSSFIAVLLIKAREDLPSDAKEAILGGNALRLVGMQA